MAFRSKSFFMFWVPRVQIRSGHAIHSFVSNPGTKRHPHTFELYSLNGKLLLQFKWLTSHMFTTGVPGSP